MKKLITIAALLISTTLSAQTFTTDTTKSDTLQTHLIKQEIQTVNEHKDFFRLTTGFLAFLVPVAFWTGNDYGMKNRR